MDQISATQTPAARAATQSTTQPTTQPTTQSTAAQVDPKTRQAAEDFEAVFLGQMLAPMFQGLETEGMFGGGSAERVYRSMMVQEYGRAMASNGGIGIADAVQREILRMQETTE